MKCGLCGRALKDAGSIERGYGPVCYGKINPGAVTSHSSSHSSSGIAESEDYNVPGQMELSDFIEMPEEGQGND